MFKLVLIIIFCSISADLFPQVSVNDLEYSADIKVDKDVVDKQQLQIKLRDLKSAVKDDPNLFKQVVEMERVVEGKDRKSLDNTELSANLNKVLEQIQKVGGIDSLESSANESTILDIEESPYSKMSREQIDGILLNHPSRSIRVLLQKSPTLRRTMAAVLQDKTAIPKMLKIVKKRAELKQYGFAVLFLFIVLFIWDLLGKKQGFVKRLTKKFVVLFLFSFGNLIIFYLFFTEELRPLLKIILTEFNA